MISSTPKLKGLGELVTKAMMTLSSTPEPASLITSASGPTGLMLGRNRFSGSLRKVRILGLLPQSRLLISRHLRCRFLVRLGLDGKQVIRWLTGRVLQGSTGHQQGHHD